MKRIQYEVSGLVNSQSKTKLKNSLDKRSELKIQQALLEVTKDRTSFIIAHRLSTIKDADKIMVIDNGSIMEMGTHEELIRKKEYYYKLYESQFN